MVIAVRVTPEEYDRLYRVAQVFGNIPVSNLARAIVNGTITPDGQLAENRRPLPGQRALV